MNLVPGLIGEKRIVVTEEYTAKHLGSGNVLVLATPAMIMLMERTALASVDPLLPIGQRTVGTLVAVKHLAATPLGMVVRVHTELLEVDGRRLKFSVEAFDEKDQIGEGVHERFVIDVETFQRRLVAKQGAQ